MSKAALHLVSEPLEAGVVDTPSGTTANVQTQGCTLEAYAGMKRLPVDFLQDLGLSQLTYSGAHAVRMPYRDASGTEMAIRFRVAIEKTKGADNRFRWKKGSKPGLYGLERLRDEPTVVLVEGESDCHTLWHYGINALGLPGAGLWKENRDAQHLAHFATIYVLVEPDQGGEATLRWIGKSALCDRIHLVRLDGFKDPSDLHVADASAFRAHWDNAIANARSWLHEHAKRQDTIRREAWTECAELAREPDVLARFAADLRRAGLVGVTKEAKLLYLSTTSRLLARPISLAVKGTSASGKSFLVETTLSFFPPEAFYALTAISEHALAYGQESLQYRMLVLYEAEGMAGDTASYLIRSLLSEGRVRYETVEKTSEGLQGRLIEREGRTGLIVTTTKEGLHPENETRLISLTLADGQDQTRAIMMALAEEDEREEVNRSPWIALQTFLAASNLRVSIPFASHLVSMIPPVAVRLRRDIKLLLNLIRAHALLHQVTRKRDAQGRVIATLADYAAIHELVADALAEGARTSVRPTTRETVEAVIALARAEGSASVSKVADCLQLDVTAASRRCTAAAKAGYIRNEETRPRQTARYVAGEPLPGEQSLLPPPERLAQHLTRPGSAGSVCTFASGPEEYNPPPLQAPETHRRRVVL
jgi:hypothetical protein